MAEQVGTVDSLHRYPVKSMLGEDVKASWADERGLLGDRAFAIVDAVTGKVASAKNPRLWKRLLECRATYAEEPKSDRLLPPIQLRLPSGVSVLSDDSAINRKLSELFERSVQLLPHAPPASTYEDYWPDLDNLSPEGHRDTVTNEQISRFAPDGTFFDMSAFHLLTHQALEALRAEAPDSKIELARFRPNIVIRSQSKPPAFVENSWAGHSLRLGPIVIVKILMPSMRCVMTTLEQPGLPSDPRILRSLVRANMVDIPGAGKYPCIGVYGSLSRKLSTGGLVNVGDPCLLD